MRILLISHTCQSKSEGQMRAERLARLDQIDLRVLSPDRWFEYGSWRQADPPAREAPYAYEVGKIAWAWMGPMQSYLHWYPNLLRTLQTFRPDIVDLWEEPWSLVAAQLCWLRNRHFPEMRILSETEQNLAKQLPPPFEGLRKYTLRNADYGVGRSAEAIEVLRAKGYRGPAEVVPNAVDTTVFSPCDREKCRRELGLVGFVVGYVGRMVEEKGLQDLLEALKLCPADVRLLFVGSGPLMPELQRRASEIDCLDRIRFLPPRPHREMAQILSAMDVLALVSRTTSRWKEQFGRVIIEAHACGVPVIGSNSGAIPEVVGSGGEIVPERDPISLAAAICKLRDSQELKKELGCIGLGQVRSHYTWEHVAFRIHRIYGRIYDRIGEPGALYA